MQSQYRKNKNMDGIWNTGFDKRQKFFTNNLDKGKTIYGERTVMLDEAGTTELREWNPYRSKLAAALHNGLSKAYLNKESKVLYLGASSGTTVSHISDISNEGIIYAVEFSARSIRDLVLNCFGRPNVIPIMGDANYPEKYSKFVSGKIDLMYQDIAQQNQNEILLKNAKYYLSTGAIIMFAIKARSISATKALKDLFDEELKMLQQNNIEILEKISLVPYSKEHLFVVGRYYED